MKPVNIIRSRIFISILFSILMLCSLIVMISGCGNRPPIGLEDLSYVMPGEKVEDYDVYRVVCVKKDVTKQELISLMEFFTRRYIDDNRVIIYIFNNRAAPHLGQTEYLVAKYFQDKRSKKLEREILLDLPK